MHDISVATKQDKKSLKRFYKSQHYSASLMGLDHCLLVRSPNGDIVAAVIISQLLPSNTQYFLHGLVVDRSHMRMGFARKLISYALNNFNNIVCFSTPDLQALYLEAGFALTDASVLSPVLQERYALYQNKNKELIVFSRIIPIEIILAE